MAFKAARTLSILALMVTVLPACGGGGNSPRLDPVPGPGPADIELITDLSDYVGSSLPYVQSFSEGYNVPSGQELMDFDTLIHGFLGGQLDAVRNSADALNFELVRVIDTGANANELYCLRERALRGQGFYCADFDAATANHVSVPHPLFDSLTNNESVAVMRGTGARLLSISTNHRCSNIATSSCSGTTSVCGAAGPYKVSDPAHYVDGFFHHFGVAAHDRDASVITIQLHGCGAAACPANGDDNDIVARLSAGTTDDLPATELVNVLNTALNEELAALQVGSAVSCSEPSADKRLCGTTNVLGRYINGQPDPCQNPAADFAESRWLHIEQNANLRRDEGGTDALTPEILIRAVNEALGSIAPAPGASVLGDPE